MRRRGACIERSFAHLYAIGGLRRTHLHRHQNILKRSLVHAGAFNLGILMGRCSVAARRVGSKDTRLTLSRLNCLRGARCAPLHGRRAYGVSPTPSVRDPMPLDAGNRMSVEVSFTTDC